MCPPDDEGAAHPDIEDVQDLIEIVLAEQLSPIVAAYKRYRKQRELARERIRVRDSATAASRGRDRREPAAGRVA